MAQVTLGKFFSGVPQIRESDGDSKKIYEHKRKRGFIDSWSKNVDGLQDSSDGMICTYSMNGHCRLHSSALHAYMALENSG
jgi:hypothetical protein